MKKDATFLHSQGLIVFKKATILKKYFFYKFFREKEMRKVVYLLAIILLTSFQNSITKPPDKIADDLKKSTVIITGFFEELDWGSNDKIDWIGTGIIIDKNNDEYLVVTNAHVVGFWDMYEADNFSPGDSILKYWLKVRFAEEQEEMQVKKVFISNKHKDLALITFSSKKNYPTINLKKEGMKVGEVVYAMGHPKGLEYTFTSGIVSAIRKYVDRATEGYKFIQTQAAINPGNSGGPLVDSDGNLVGINTMKIVEKGVEGLGFAISVNELIDMLDKKDMIEMPTDNRLISQWLRQEFKKTKNK